ncbi:MAG: hypothetical protein IIA14_15210 [SAR324 cluster bacterium]|nr:hypothetical protein [SAR324 cluster bacterium]
MAKKQRWWDTWLVRLAPLTHQRSGRIILTACIASVVGGWFAWGLTGNLKTDMAEMLPDSFRSVQTLRRIEERLGGLGSLRLTIECPELAVAKQYAEALAPRLLDSPLINYLDYKSDVTFFKQYGLLYLETDELYDLQDAIDSRIAKEKRKLNPLLVTNLFGDEDDEDADSDSTLKELEGQWTKRAKKEYYLNPDSTLIIMDVFPTGTSGNVGFARKLLAEVQRIVKADDPARYHPPEIRVRFGEPRPLREAPPFLRPRRRPWPPAPPVSGRSSPTPSSFRCSWCWDFWWRCSSFSGSS